MIRAYSFFPFWIIFRKSSILSSDISPNRFSAYRKLIHREICFRINNQQYPHFYMRKQHHRRYGMTNKILLDKLQDCISFYKKNPGDPDLKEIVFSRLEFLDHQEFFEANVSVYWNAPSFSGTVCTGACFPRSSVSALRNYRSSACTAFTACQRPHHDINASAGTSFQPHQCQITHPISIRLFFAGCRSGSRFSTESWLQLMIS